MSPLIKDNKELPKPPRWQACLIGILVVAPTLLSAGILYAQQPSAYIGPPRPISITRPVSQPGPRVALGPNVLPNVIINDRSLQQPGETQSELSVAAFGDIVVAGFNDCSGFRDPTIRNGIVGWGFSADGGFTWTDLGQAGALPLDNPGELGTQGDPSLDVDANGNFYLASIYQRVPGNFIVRNVTVHKGRFDGVSGKVVFDRPKFATNFTTWPGADKEHIGVDKNTGYIYVSYTYCSTGACVGQIEVVRSTDGGQTWSAPVILAPESSTTHQGSVPRIGPNGEVYVAWEDGWRQPVRSIHIRKSTNWPNFGPDITVSTVTPAALPEPLDRIGNNEFPTMAIDMSNGPNRGRVYVAWGDGRFGNPGTGGNIGSILLSHSADGTAWTQPIRVNDDPLPQAADTHHWLPWMSVDANGMARVAWYDRRLRFVNCNENCGARTDVFAASVTVAVGGNQNTQVTDQTFSMDVSCSCGPCFGDYIGAYATGTRFHVAWGDGRNQDPDAFGGGFILQ